MNHLCHCTNQETLRRESVCIEGLITIPEHLVSPCYIDDASVRVCDIHWDSFDCALQISARADVFVKYVGLDNRLYAINETVDISACASLNCRLKGLGINVLARASTPEISLVPAEGHPNPCSPDRMNIAFKAFVIFEIKITSFCPPVIC